MMTQLDLFGGEKVIKGKKNKPVQMDMFTAFDLGFGVSANPVSDDVVTMRLIAEDIRTPEQRESDLTAAAVSLTLPLF
jgi:hypothetical protein